VKLRSVVSVLFISSFWTLTVIGFLKPKSLKTLHVLNWFVFWFLFSVLSRIWGVWWINNWVFRLCGHFIWRKFGFFLWWINIRLNRWVRSFIQFDLLFILRSWRIDLGLCINHWDIFWRFFLRNHFLMIWVNKRRLFLYRRQFLLLFFSDDRRCWFFFPVRCPHSSGWFLRLSGNLFNFFLFRIHPFSFNHSLRFQIFWLNPHGLCPI